MHATFVSQVKVCQQERKKLHGFVGESQSEYISKYSVNSRSFVIDIRIYSRDLFDRSNFRENERMI